MLRKEGEEVTKNRLDYVYRAFRIDPNDSQNLGDFRISRKVETPYGSTYRSYHYASEDYHDRRRQGRLINRSDLISIARGTRIYNDCMKAIERLIEEENRPNETQNQED